MASDISQLTAAAADGLPAGRPVAGPARRRAHRPLRAERRRHRSRLLTAGRSTVLTTDFDITRIAVTNPAIADAVVVRPREVLVDGKAPGTVSLIVWGGDQRKHYDVVVDRG